MSFTARRMIETSGAIASTLCQHQIHSNFITQMHLSTSHELNSQQISNIHYQAGIHLFRAGLNGLGGVLGAYFKNPTAGTSIASALGEIPSSFFHSREVKIQHLQRTDEACWDKEQPSKYNSHAQKILEIAQQILQARHQVFSSLS